MPANSRWDLIRVKGKSPRQGLYVEVLHKKLNIPVHNLVINCMWVDEYSNKSHSGCGFQNKILVTFKPILFYACHITWVFLSGGREFDFRWCHWNFSLTSSFRQHQNSGSAQPRTEMSTRNIFWELKAAGVSTLHLVASIVWKSRSLGYLERSGRVEGPTVTAVPKPEGRGFDYR